METDIVDRFNSMPWHDAKLLGISVQVDDSTYEHAVVLRCRMAATSSLGDTVLRRVVILACRAMQARLDLLGKSCASNDISGASCNRETPRWREVVTDVRKRFDLYQEAEDAFDSLYLFEIELIPPGGDLVFLAGDFSIEDEPE